MTAAVTASEAVRSPGYRHEALFYAGPAAFLSTTLPFVQEAVAAGEPVLVVTGGERLELLRAAIDTDDAVTLADMEAVGQNPGRIIALWSDFVAKHASADRPVRGIGEPIYPERIPAELSECQLHEDLLNVAFDSTTPLWLLCPYDTDALPDDVITEARSSHPYLADGGTRRRSPTYRPLDTDTAFGRPLPPAPASAATLEFSAEMLGNLRAYVSTFAVGAGMRPDRAADLVLAANEVISNSLRHGGGSGALRLWTEGDRIVCEIADSGRITDPLIGRLPPAQTAPSGRGLWIANQVCDLVQINSSCSGTTVRLHLVR